MIYINNNNNISAIFIIINFFFNIPKYFNVLLKDFI